MSRNEEPARELPSAAIPMPASSQVPSVEEIQQWIGMRLAQLVQVEPEEIDFQVPLVRYGLDSVELVLFVTDLERWIGLKFTKNPLNEQSTIHSLAEHLAALKSSSATKVG